MFLNRISFRVRYGETDQMGVVYHANYATYFEVGRTEWLREFGLSYNAMEQNGIMLPVVDLSIRYKASAKYDDLVTVETTLVETPSVSIAFNYRLLNAEDKVLATGYTKLVFINSETQKIMRCPNFLLEKLKEAV